MRTTKILTGTWTLGFDFINLDACGFQPSSSPCSIKGHNSNTKKMNSTSCETDEAGQRLIEIARQYEDRTLLKEFKDEGIEQLVLQPRSHLFHYLLLVEMFVEKHGYHCLPIEEHRKKMNYEFAATSHVRMFHEHFNRTTPRDTNKVPRPNKKRKLKEPLTCFQDTSTSKTDHRPSDSIQCKWCLRNGFSECIKNLTLPNT